VSKLIVKPKFHRRVERHLERHRERVAGRATAILVDEILARTPIEDGHAHEAWSRAAEDVASQLQRDGGGILSAVAPYGTLRSGDPKAIGHGFVSDTGDTLIIEMQNTLDFVKILEEGGTIRPIAPGGRKVPPAAQRPGQRGPLFGTRESEGRGMVFWMEGGKARFAPSHTVRRGNFVRDALIATKRQLKPLKARKL